MLCYYRQTGKPREQLTLQGRCNSRFVHSFAGHDFKDKPVKSIPHGTLSTTTGYLVETDTIMSYDKRLMSSPDVAVFRRAGQYFHCLTPDTAWLRQLLPMTDLENARMDLSEFSPYLKSFAEEAQPHWSSITDSPLRSAQWIEITPSGRKLTLYAQAVNSNDQKLLVVTAESTKSAHTETTA